MPRIIENIESKKPMLSLVTDETEVVVPAETISNDPRLDNLLKMIEENTVILKKIINDMVIMHGNSMEMMHKHEELLIQRLDFIDRNIQIKQPVKENSNYLFTIERDEMNNIKRVHAKVEK